MPTASVPDVRPVSVIREALRHAPAEVRNGLRWGLLVWVAVMTLQAVDVWDRRGPGVVAEMMSVLLGTSGAVLVCLIGVLRSADPRRGQDAAADLVVALPALGFAAGALLASACAIVVMRAVLGASSVFAAAMLLVYGGFLWVAAATVTETTGRLYRSARAQAEAAARADAAAAEARLVALQAQMNPHFLFNALNTVAALVRHDAAAAERTVTNLAEVLRRTLRRTTQKLTTLDEEIAYVEAYLGVEQERWRSRLRVVWDVEAETRPLPVPPMTVQPLVENALRHGLSDRLEGGTITIGARREAQTLRITVSDDGGAFVGGREGGTGLANLRARLDAQYGGAASLDVAATPAATTVAIVVPLAAGDPDARADRGR